MRNTLLSVFLALTMQAQVLPPISPVRPGGMPFIRSYKPVNVPVLRAPARIRVQALIRGGNLYLTVHDALELAIEASLDLEVERYNMLIADWNVQRQQSGGPLRGVTGANVPVVSLGAGQGVAGSQSGNSGSGASGTATIAGAALVQQIGAVTPQLDPIYAAGVSIAHQTLLQTQVVQSGTIELVDTARSYTYQVSQGLLTGGSVRMTYNGSYLNEAVPLDVLNPTSFSSLGISYNQALLQGFGERVNGRFIRVAKRRAGMSGLAFEQRLSGVVTNTLNLYWDLSVAADDLKYKQRNYDIARQFVADTDREIGAGAVPAIDRVSARSALAVQQQALTVAQNTLLQRENAMKDALSWHGRQEPELDGVHVIAVDPLEVPTADDLPPVEMLLGRAGERRRDLAIIRANADIAATNAIGTANVVLPTLNVGVSSTNVGQTGQAVGGQSPDPYFVGGAGSALGQVFRRNFPNVRAGVSFNTQIRNIQAQADAGMDELLQRQSVLAAQRAANQLGVDIANQVLSLRQARTRYQSAIESRALIERLLTGEEKKLLSGTSTVATVVGARRDLATAQSTELAAAATYMHNRVALDQALGQALEVNHISVDTALGR